MRRRYITQEALQEPKRREKRREREIKGKTVVVFTTPESFVRDRAPGPFYDVGPNPRE